MRQGACVDREGRVWLGLDWDYGLAPAVCRWDGERLEEIRLPEGEHIGGAAFSIAEDVRGDLWFGVWAWLYRYDGEGFHRICGHSDPPGYIW